MKVNQKKLITFLGTACCIFLIAALQTGCKGCCKKPLHTVLSWRNYISDSPYQHIPADPSQQIVVWRTPGSYDGNLDNWLDSIVAKCGPIKITVFCGSCDSSLMLLSGLGVQTFIQGNGGTTGGGKPCNQATNPNCGPTGGDTIYWSVNFPVDINDFDTVAGYTSPKPLTIFSNGTGRPITVAVFDTGVDSLELSNSKYLYQNNTPTCLDPMANNGWNFPAKDNAIHDDYVSPTLNAEHGAIVSKMIVQQVIYYHQNNVKILPVKIHNAKGESDLFSVLCGFAYAKERGAEIINASFGYYSPKRYPAVNGVVPLDSSALMLKKYIQYYLTSNNILLIAAAGNLNDAEETAVFTNGLRIPDNLRSLDSVDFYPASLSADPEMTNVIAVTTVDVSSGTVSPLQNYSPNVVDIGVNADTIIGEKYCFINTNASLFGVSEGSSFATPVATGMICSYYSMIIDSLAAKQLPFTKQNIINFLQNKGVGSSVSSTPLSRKIKTTVMLNKALHSYYPQHPL